MNCDEVHACLIDYAHEELDADDSRDVTGHLAECRDCALEFCQLRADLAGIAAAATETPSPSVRASLRRRVERELAPSWGRRLGRLATRPVPAFGLAVAALLPIAIWVGTTWRPPETAEPPPPIVTDFDGARVWTNPDLI